MAVPWQVTPYLCASRGEKRLSVSNDHGPGAIVRRTGRTPESIVKTALRIGAVIKGRPKPKA
jgi:hypothetical protein